jgi:hypothetical protein
MSIRSTSAIYICVVYAHWLFLTGQIQRTPTLNNSLHLNTSFITTTSRRRRRIKIIEMNSTALSLSDLCSKCSMLTFEMFWQGFEHPLTYKQQIESGKRCKLCRLMVCTFSRLQVDANCYEVARNYEAYAPLLLSRKAVFRDDATARPNSPGLLMEKMMDPPLHLFWVRHGTFPGVWFQDGSPDFRSSNDNRSHSSDQCS